MKMQMSYKLCLKIQTDYMTTFTIISISYIAVVFMVLRTFRFLRERNVTSEAEYYSLHSIPPKSQEGAA